MWWFQPRTPDWFWSRQPLNRRLRGLLRSMGVPVLVLPGNHDSARRMSAELCDEVISFPKQHDNALHLRGGGTRARKQLHGFRGFLGHSFF